MKIQETSAQIQAKKITVGKNPDGIYRIKGYIKIQVLKEETENKVKNQNDAFTDNIKNT